MIELLTLGVRDNKYNNKTVQYIELKDSIMNTLATRACLLLLAGLGLFLNGCKSDVWCDSSGLCWQAEQYQYGNKDFGGFVPAEAAAYCDALVLDGHDDWRLPTINELRSIVAGNADVMTGGACNVIDGSVTSDGFNPACLGAEKYRGPSDEGCYWNRALDGSCDTPDLGSVGRPLETWAMNPASNNPEQWVAYIGFDSATLGFNDSCSLGEVRCVRGKPADCLINGQPCTSYFPSRSFCDQDLSAQADSIELTIRVPEKLAYQPYQILAFLYEADNFSFPPLGPPDAGTDYNQLIQPQIDIDTPLTMTIPATTFYREELVSGNFRLYVGLQMNEKYPPIPSSEDYIWGDNQAAIALPINGIEHTGASIPMDITLEAVGCGGSTPFACADGSCAIDASA